MVNTVYHILIGADDCKIARNRFHSRRIVGVIKALRFFYRTLGRMIRQQQRQQNMWMRFLCSNHSVCCHAVKATIVSDYKLCNTVFYNMLLHRISQKRKYFARHFSVSDKKQRLFCITSPLREKVYTNYRRYSIPHLQTILDLKAEVSVFDQLRTAFQDNERKGDFIVQTEQDGISPVELLCNKTRREYLHAHAEHLVQTLAMQGKRRP